MSTRLGVNINDETAEALKDLAGRRGTYITETVRRAVSIYSFLIEAQERGDRIQLRDGDEITRVVIS